MSDAREAAQAAPSAPVESGGGPRGKSLEAPHQASQPPSRPASQQDQGPDAGADPLAHEPQSVGLWNIANGLTITRLLLVPVFVALLFQDGANEPVWRAWAFAAFAVASVTDRLDGELARKRGLVTDFGKVADPIADKALTGSALVGLSVLGELPWWVTVVVLVREVGVTLLRFWVIRHGVIAASRGGKLKTLLQGIAIGLYILVIDGWLRTVSAVVMAAAVALTLATGLDYVYRALRVRRTSERTARRRAQARAARQTRDRRS